MLHIALYQPQIPGNTGNIGRLCAGFDCHLHLIGPCAFDFSDARLRRAGLDYWPQLAWTLHADPAAWLAWLGDRTPWLITKFGRTCYTDAAYAEEDVIVLGNEVRGLPLDWHRRWPERCLHIPILGRIRAFNLANCASMVVGHARWRSGRFAGWTPPPLPTGDLNGAPDGA